jgi:hypothetical protein
VNINRVVWVRLTPEAKRLLRADHDALMPPHADRYPHTPPKEDADGWSEWQLWCLMADIGKHIYMGGPQLIVDNEIRFEKPSGEGEK